MSTPISIINGATSPSVTSSSAAANSAANSGSTLTQQDFLKIMVAQFTAQNPLSSDSGSGGGTSDYVNQLMSMTNLTTMQNMSAQQADQLMGTLPGATVGLNNNGTPISGVVQATSLNNGTVYVTVGGTAYPLSDLTSVTKTAAQNTAAPTTGAASGTGTGG